MSEEQKQEAPRAVPRKRGKTLEAPEVSAAEIRAHGRISTNLHLVRDDAGLDEGTSDVDTQRALGRLISQLLADLRQAIDEQQPFAARSLCSQLNDLSAQLSHLKSEDRVDAALLGQLDEALKAEDCAGAGILLGQLEELQSDAPPPSGIGIMPRPHTATGRHGGEALPSHSTSHFKEGAPPPKKL